MDSKNTLEKQRDTNWKELEISLRLSYAMAVGKQPLKNTESTKYLIPFLKHDQVRKPHIQHFNKHAPVHLTALSPKQAPVKCYTQGKCNPFHS